MADYKDVEKVKEIRKKIFLTGYKGGMAHLASCFSCVEMLYAFYLKGLLRYNKSDSRWKDRDRFILSKGHAALALYAILNEAKLISDEMYNSYLTDNSMIGGEPCMIDSDFIEATTGSLGHGLSMGLGMAMALKQDESDAKVYVLMGDGELQEGSVWEAGLTAHAFSINNLIAIVDNNKIQKMDYIKNIIGEPLWKNKWESFGWKVVRTDGHDIDSFSECVKKESIDQTKPVLIIADTLKGKGVSIMENNPNWHFKLPNKKELVYFKNELGILDEELE